MNLHAIVSPYIQSINPSFVGTWQSSSGAPSNGDATVTGSITANILTVSAVASGSLVVGSVIQGVNMTGPTTIASLGTGAGGTGIYNVNPTPDALSGPITASFDGTRTPQFTSFPNLLMQVQALSAADLKQLDGLNLQGIVRSVYMSGFPQGVNRPAAQGGDLLMIPTGLSGTTPDTWLVAGIIEQWDASGWTKVAVTLQNPPQDQ